MEKRMIRSDNGKVEMYGDKSTILRETSYILKALLSEKIVDPEGIFDIVGKVLNDEGIIVVKGNEEDLGQLLEQSLEEILDEVIEEKLSEIAKSDEIDSDEADDIFRFLRDDE